jgi:hypothetical protein
MAAPGAGVAQLPKRIIKASKPRQNARLRLQGGRARDEAVVVERAVLPQHQ